MRIFESRVLATDRYVLGEGPLRTGPDGVLWVDIEQGAVFRATLVGDELHDLRRTDFGGTVGAAVVARDGSLLVAGRDRLLVESPSGERTEGPRIVPLGSTKRTNDGAVDPAGRFLVGTLANAPSTVREALVRIEDDGSVTVIDDDLSLANGIAWSPDGLTLYYADTLDGVIWSRDYDVVTGSVGARQPHVRITSGFPDGICTDSEGCLWVAVWGGGEVRRFDPDGVLVGVITVAAPHVSSVAFVGPESDRLLITTASRDLSSDELKASPGAGRLFVADVGITGRPKTPWSASWL